jgi:predicted PurR-regulated permease PerM
MMQPSKSDWRSLHLWQIQFVRDVLVIVMIVALIWLGYELSLVTVPMLLALLLAYLFEPFVKWATRPRGERKQRYIGRQGVAAILVLAAALLIVVPATLGFGFAAVQATNAAVGIADNARSLKNALEAPDDPTKRDALKGSWRWIYDHVTASLAPVPVPTDTQPASGASEPPPAVPRPLMQRLTDSVEERREVKRIVTYVSSWVSSNADSLGKSLLGAGTQAVGVAARGFTTLGTLALSTFLTAFFFFFFCTGYGHIQKFWEGLIPERKRGRVVNLLSRMDRVIAGFVRGRLTICAILIVVYTIGYAALGVPAWTIVGPAVGLLTLIPYAASAAAPIAMLLLFLNSDGSGVQSQWWWIVGGPIVILALVQLLDDYVLTPKIQGDATGMDTPSILFSSIAGGILGGFYGLLLAIPVAACLKILLHEFFWPRVKAWAAGKEPDILPIPEK